MSTFMWILKKIIDDTHKRKSYWSQVQVTTHPVVPYYKPNEQLIHSRTLIWCKIYICSHSITDSPIAKPYILPCILLSTDSPTSQYKNKTIFKTLPWRSEPFLSNICSEIKHIDNTMKLHTSAANKLWLRKTSCFCQNSIDKSFKLETVCNAWHESTKQKDSQVNGHLNYIAPEVE